MWTINHFTPRTDYDLYDLFPVQQYSSSRSARQGRYIPDVVRIYDLAHVDGWEAYATCTIYCIGHVSWVGSELYTDPAQHLTTAGKDLMIYLIYLSIVFYLPDV